MNLKEFKQKITLYKEKVSDVAEGILFLEGNFLLDVDKETKQIRLNKEPTTLHEGDMIIVTPYAHGIYTDHFLNEITKANIQLFKLDFYGNPVWELHQKTRTKANLIESQILLNEPEYQNKRVALIKNLVSSKLQSEVEPIPIFPKANKNMNQWIKEVMALEGRNAANYWEKYIKQNQFDDIMNRRATKGSKTVKTNRNAVDMINVLLNLGYGILAHKITFALYEWGLEPTIGVYHSYDIHDNRYSLVWDIIEPERVKVDEIVSKHADEIDTTQFTYDVTHEKRYMMLKFVPHMTGRITKSSYKKWVSIFTEELPKDFKFITEYRKTLKEILTDRGIGADNLRRIIGNIKEKTPEIKQEVNPEKPIKELSHEPIEDLTKPIKEPENINPELLKKKLKGFRK